MKRVSFKVAKAIKEAGFLQPKMDVQGYVLPCTCYFTGKYEYYDEYRERKLEFDEIDELHTESDWNKEDVSFYGSAIAAPSYLEVWLWLWREKKIRIELVIDDITDKSYPIVNKQHDWLFDSDEDPEEAIIAAIKYLVENNLIK